MESRLAKPLLAAGLGVSVLPASTRRTERHHERYELQYLTVEHDERDGVVEGRH